jgi:hypothetical protein
MFVFFSSRLGILGSTAVSEASFVFILVPGGGRGSPRSAWLGVAGIQKDSKDATIDEALNNISSKSLSC